MVGEREETYEVGAKLDALNGRLGVAMGSFPFRGDDAKNADPTDPTRVVLTGQQRATGAMITLNGSLTPRWRVYGGYATMNARITSDTTAAPAGRTVGLVPRNQFTLWSTYDVTDCLGAGGGVVSQSKMYTSFTNQVDCRRSRAWMRGILPVRPVPAGRERRGTCCNATYDPTGERRQQHLAGCAAQRAVLAARDVLVPSR